MRLIVYGDLFLSNFEVAIMQRQNVSSSNIHSIGYDGITRTLEIQFLDWSIYQYSHVPNHVYIGLMNAPSHGSYFHRHVKKAGFSYRKVA